MDRDFPLAVPTQTVEFDEFWTWLQGHFNCVLRAGTHDMAVFDDESLHWRFSGYDAESCLIQVGKGKVVLAEMALYPVRISYVQVTELGPDEFLYEMVYDENGVKEVTYFVVLAHDFDAEDPAKRQWMN